LSNSIVEEGCSTFEEVSVNHVVSPELLAYIEDFVRDRRDTIVSYYIEICSFGWGYKRSKIKSPPLCGCDPCRFVS
jgi:hypothetical protein